MCDALIEISDQFPTRIPVVTEHCDSICEEHSLKEFYIRGGIVISGKMNESDSVISMTENAIDSDCSVKRINRTRKLPKHDELEPDGGRRIISVIIKVYSSRSVN